MSLLFASSDGTTHQVAGCTVSILLQKIIHSSILMKIRGDNKRSQ